MALDALPGFALPLVAAMAAGGLIGFEREWRGRAAGLRTHILVALASALLMEAAVAQGLWRFLPLPGAEIVSDPARMAHGVLTGIGFLCAGVIFRSGFSIHGLTTAASLWITAALGLVFGAGLYGLGSVATALTVIVLVALRLISSRLPRTSTVDAKITWRRDAPDAGTAIWTILESLDRRPEADHHGLSDNGSRVVLRLRLIMTGPDEITLLARRLQAIDGVTSFDLDPRDD